MTRPMRKGEAVGRTILGEAALAAAAAVVGRRNRLAGAALLSVGAAAAWGAFARNNPIYGRVLHRGSGTDGRFALTFDDGPGPSTPAVLDALAAVGAHATFFVLGRQVERHPDLLERIVEEGHEVANHGYDHGILVFRHARHVAEQLRRTETAVARIVGDGVISRVFRAPHGFRGPLTAAGARAAGYNLAGWSVGVFDSDQPGAEVIAQRAIAALEPGTILLLHDADGWEPDASRAQTAQAIAPICQAARARGLEPAPLGALA